MNGRQEPVSFDQWLHLYLLMLLPVYNIVKLLELSKAEQEHPAIVNWAKAMLVFFLIAAGLGVVSWLVSKAIIAGSSNAM